MKNELAVAIELRNKNKPNEALRLLKELLETHPNDPDINYQAAWTCDSMGREREAVLYYETALANGLVQDRDGALLGLGSTYRCLGEYKKSLQVFDRGLQEFPENRPLMVFRALTHYNLGEAKESVRQLLIQLIDTTSDASIKSYERALRFYSERLNETWTSVDE
jgi:tetratricopeptide (TPR) repeat protein